MRTTPNCNIGICHQGISSDLHGGGCCGAVMILEVKKHTQLHSHRESVNRSA
jgi:hypothetical protein